MSSRAAPLSPAVVFRSVLRSGSRSRGAGSEARFNDSGLLRPDHAADVGEVPPDPAPGDPAPGRRQGAPETPLEARRAAGPGAPASRAGLLSAPCGCSTRLARPLALFRTGDARVISTSTGSRQDGSDPGAERRRGADRAREGEVVDSPWRRERSADRALPAARQSLAVCTRGGCPEPAGRRSAPRERSARPLAPCSGGQRRSMEPTGGAWTVDAVRTPRGRGRAEAGI